MAERDAKYTLRNIVQLDDAYLGEEISGGTAGRGSENEVPSVAAVSLDASGNPVELELTKFRGHLIL